MSGKLTRQFPEWTAEESGQPFHRRVPGGSLIGQWTDDTRRVQEILLRREADLHPVGQVSPTAGMSEIFDVQRRRGRSDSTRPSSKVKGHHDGAVTNPNDHGPLSTFVHSRISSLEITWTDPEIFTDDEAAVRFLRSRLGAAVGSRHTFVIWSQALGTPSLTANARHVNGTTGRLLIWKYKDISALYELYAYLDGDG